MKFGLITGMKTSIIWCWQYAGENLSALYAPIFTIILLALQKKRGRHSLFRLFFPGAGVERIWFRMDMTLTGVL